MSITRVEAYNPFDMSLLSSDITGLNFGTIIKGSYCQHTAVIKPIIVGDMSALSIFLENNGGFNHAMFGCAKASDAITGIYPGDPRISDYFITDPGVSDFTTSDYGLSLDPIHPEYIWLDLNIGSNSIVGAGTANYRFVFEYN
jgi:hypothetical protein